MRDLGSRVLVGLGVIVAAVVAVGYAFVYLGIAEPPSGALGTVAVPAPGSVAAATLDDGLPVFVALVDGTPTVLDARAPATEGAASSLVAWCEDAGAYVDLRQGRTFGPSGAALGDAAGGGMTRYASTAVDGGARLRVDAETEDAGADPGGAEPACPEASDWVVHAPVAGDVFDPSVVVDQEPAGWSWVEGRLEASDGAVRLCDGLAGPCATWAPVTGIDPATVEATTGLFLGRVQDDALRDLVIVPAVPDLGGSS